MMEDSSLDGSNIKNMKFCKPRYNSAASPLARNILFVDVVPGLCVELSAVRNGTEPARDAQLFLDTVDEEM